MQTIFPLSLKKLKNNNPTKITFLSFLIVFVVLIIFLTISTYYSDKMLPNTNVAGIDVSGKTKSEAHEILSSEIASPQLLELVVKGDIYELSLDGIEFSYDLENTINSAFSENRNQVLTTIIFSSFTKKQASKTPLYYSLNNEKLTEYLNVISSKVAVAAVEPGITLIDNKVIIEKGTPGEQVDVELFKQTLSNNLKNNDFAKIDLTVLKTGLTLDENQSEQLKNRGEKLLGSSLMLINEYDKFVLNDKILLTFLDSNDKFANERISSFLTEEITPKVNRNPQNAVFKFQEGKVQEFIPAKNGLKVNADELGKLITGGIDKLQNSKEKNLTINIPVETQAPEITTDKVNSLGVNELIGRGSSSFRGSIPGRVYNVSLAASKFDGVLIPPGQTASFNNIVGDVSSLTGYKQAYIIKDGRTVLGDGGGVCQVSTTLFRAALDAGLPIVERRAHSYRVGYYEQDSKPGIDATVYSPTTDLKFINDTPGHLLIQTIYNAGKATLVFEIYGTSDGRIATISEPLITSFQEPPEDLYVDDSTLPLGTIKQIDYKAWGAKASFDYKVVRGG